MTRWLVLGAAGLSLVWLAARQVARIEDREFLLHD